MIAPWWQDDLKTQLFMAVGEYSLIIVVTIVGSKNIYEFTKGESRSA